MTDPLLIAIIAAGSAIVGGGLTAYTNHALSRRQFSKSGARLKADLELLEKARSVGLEAELIAELERYVAKRVRKHTHGKGDS